MHRRQPSAGAPKDLHTAKPSTQSWGRVQPKGLSGMILNSRSSHYNRNRTANTSENRQKEGAANAKDENVA